MAGGEHIDIQNSFICESSEIRLLAQKECEYLINLKELCDNLHHAENKHETIISHSVNIRTR